MAEEREVKIRVDQHDPFVSALSEAGALHMGAALQTDSFFDWPDGRLRGAGCGLRLRRIEPLGGAALLEGPAADLTYKGPRTPNDNGYKVRPEYESAVGDSDAVQEILESLGMRRVMVIQKRRISYRLGDCEVELDELPLAGRFIEIEGPDDEAIASVCRRIGLCGEAITESYLSLLERAARERGLPADRILFNGGGQGESGQSA